MRTAEAQDTMRLFQHYLGATVLVGGALAALEGFPPSGKGLWYTTPGSIWTTQYLPVGNGYLGGAHFLNPREFCEFKRGCSDDAGRDGIRGYTAQYRVPLERGSFSECGML